MPLAEAAARRGLNASHAATNSTTLLLDEDAAGGVVDPVVVMVESRVESRSAETARGSAPSVTSTATSSSSYVEVTFTSSRSDAVGRCDDLVPEPERPRCGVPRGPARAVDVAFF